MNLSTQSILELIAALGLGGLLQALVGYFKDRKKTVSDTKKTDVETKLAYLNAVIERLDAEAKRTVVERDRLAQELSQEQERSAALRRRVRELEDEIDAVRTSARDTQYKCDDLARRLKELMLEAQEEQPDDPRFQ